VNDTTPTSDSVAIGQAVADNLHRIGELPDGSFVGGYLVLAKIVRLDGTEEAAWIHSQGMGEIERLGLLRKVQLAMERD
jgi:hypothetical protein